MSLNGLDDPAVIDAYQTALAEAGGWLLLKYASRDEVTLLSRGTGGVSEVRAAVDGYQEKSPLYGFLQYRRRKVVLKYFPEGMSRLLQARTTVQFQSVADKFSPQDTIFAFAASSELTEGALSSACLLHAASGSMTSSSSSLRRQKLTGIVEDAEEPSTSSPAVADDQPTNSLSLGEEARIEESDSSRVPTSPQKVRDTPTGANSVRPSEETDYVRPKTGVSTSTAQNASLEELTHQLSYEPRGSLQSGRPSMQELDYTILPRPKVKLGPRPSVDIKGRPRTAGSASRGQEFRPVASLPAGVRSSSRKSQPDISAQRPKSQVEAPGAFSSYLKDMPPVPKLLATLPPPPPSSAPRRPKSPGAKSMTALPSSGMSPEKARLMKALELRKRQMEKRTKELQKQHQTDLAKDPQATNVVSDAKEQTVQSANQPVSDHTELPIAADKLESSPNEERVNKESSPPQVPVPLTEVKEDHDVTTAPLHQEDGPAEEEHALASNQVEIGGLSVPKTIEAIHTAEPATEDHETILPGTSTTLVDAGVKKTGSENTTLQLPTAAEINASHSVGPHQETEAQTEHNVIPTSSSTSATQLTSSASSKPDSAVEVLVVDADKAEDAKYMNSELSKSSYPVIVAIADRGIPSQTAAAGVIDAGTDQPNTLMHEARPLELNSAGQSQPSIEGESAAKEPTEDTVLVGPEEIPLPEPSKAASLGVSEAEELENDGKKRPSRPSLVPIQIPVEDSDDDNLLSDDSFMEELKSATVQEAKPVFSMGKSPLSPSGQPQTPLEAWKSARAVSNPTADADLQALPVGARSMSGSFENQQSRSVPVLVAKKVNVSSGISKRIKALEMFSNSRDNGTGSPPNLPPAGTTPAPSPFDKFRKRSSLSFSGGSSTNLTTPKPTPYLTPSPSPEVSTRATPHTNKYEAPVRNKRNSVSVTAHIVREPNSSSANISAKTLEPGPLNLQRSPLTVERDLSDDSSQPAMSALNNEEMATSASSKRNSAVVSSPRPESTTSSRSRSEDKRSQTNGETSSGAEEKRESRASRIFRRMSSLTTSPRRNMFAPTSSGALEEVTLVLPKEGETPKQTSQVLDVGEVNVQFPDTLLWKRRFMRVDNEGYLILTPANLDSSTRNVVKRYHLSDFKSPCLPDEDRQELPNSILLDFLNGSTLQCACESRQGQAMVLQTLVDAHNKYQTYIK